MISSVIRYLFLSRLIIRTKYPISCLIQFSFLTQNDLLFKSSFKIHMIQRLLQVFGYRFNVRSTNADTPEAIQVICKLVIVVIQVYQVQFLISTIISSKKYYFPEYFYLNDKFLSYLFGDLKFTQAFTKIRQNK